MSTHRISLGRRLRAWLVRRGWCAGWLAAWPAAAGPEYATPSDKAMMHEALAQARAAAERGEVPVGAVVYETATGRVLACAGNTREAQQSPTGHAEIAAMEAAARILGSWRLDACTLVVTLEPCAMCAGAIVQARLGRVVYGASDPKAGFAGSLGNIVCDARLNHRVQPIAGVHADECAKLLKAFFAARRQRNSTVKRVSGQSQSRPGEPQA